MKYKRYNTIIPKCDEYQWINSFNMKRGFTQLFNEQELKNNNSILTNNNKSEDEIFYKNSLNVEEYSWSCFIKMLLFIFEKIVLFVIIVYLCELLR